MESARRGAGTAARREEGQDAGPAARGSAAAPRLDRHVGRRWPRRPGAAGGDDLQLRPGVGLRRHAYLRNGGTLECAQAIAGHECACTTQLYDSTADDITAEDIERIRFLRIAGILTNLAWGGVPAGNGVGVSGRQVLSTASRTASRFRTRWDPLEPTPNPIESVFSEFSALARPDYESAALPTELRRRVSGISDLRQARPCPVPYRQDVPILVRSRHGARLPSEPVITGRSRHAGAGWRRAAWPASGPRRSSSSGEPSIPASCRSTRNVRATGRVGETLTASTAGITDADGLSGVTFAVQWVSSDGAADADIAGATGSSYRLADADEGSRIKSAGDVCGRCRARRDADQRRDSVRAPRTPLTATFEDVRVSTTGAHSRSRRGSVRIRT